MPKENTTMNTEANDLTAALANAASVTPAHEVFGQKLTSAINEYLEAGGRAEGAEMTTVKAMTGLADCLGALLAAFPESDRKVAISSAVERIVQAMLRRLAEHADAKTPANSK